MADQSVHSYWITASGREGSSGSAEACLPYWSFTKPEISICALKLVESGELALDARLNGEHYNLRQVLMHTYGLPNYEQFSAYHSAVAAKKTPCTRDKLLDVTLANEMLFEPTQGWSYSNIGYMFVVELIEATMEKPLREIISELVCKPLNLNSIELADTREQFGKALGRSGGGPFSVNAAYHFPDFNDPITLASFTDGVAEFVAKGYSRRSMTANSA